MTTNDAPSPDAQPPPCQPQPPPRKRWPARHKVVTALLSAAVVIIIIVVIAAVAAAPKPKGANSASAASPTPSFSAYSKSVHPADGCWTVAQPDIRKIAADLTASGSVSAFATGRYSSDLGVFSYSGSVTCESGSVENAKAPSEATFDTDMNTFVGDVQSFLDGGATDITDFASVRSDVQALEADYGWPVTTMAAVVTPAPKPTPRPPPFRSQTLLGNSGSGSYTTVQFTVGGSGDYDVYWTYSEGGFGQSVNFQIWADGGADFNVTDPNQLGTGGSGVIHVYGDSGTHTLTVNSEGDWTIRVVTAP
jgi:hypothetical protein